MSELLKFGCPAPNCGRKFFTKEKLETHIKLRHPLLSFPPSSTDDSNQISTTIENNSTNNINVNTKTINNKQINNNQNKKIIQENKNEPKPQLKENIINKSSNNNVTTKNNANIINKEKINDKK